MSSVLNPYITFDGEARDALAFYQSVFGGEVSMNTFGEFGNDDDALKDKIMHGMLSTPSGYTLMCSDRMPDLEHRPGTNFTISLSGDDADELRGYFEKLAEGGTVGVELAQQVWGDEYGQCTDRFGIDWMVDIYPPSS
ncbi:MAG TPA: VOC family protein [Microlunatus sp.]|nr:VOC family protein [Microlunatus sp.]